MLRLLFIISTLLLMGCPPTITIEEPIVPSLEEDLGAFQLGAIARNFIPYQTVNTLVFITEDSTEYNFIMTAPQYIDNSSFQDIYPNPDDPEQSVYYRYNSDMQRFTFITSELGARFDLEVRSSICGDPQLLTEDIVFDFLHIRGTGFNSADITVLPAGFQLDITRDNFCGNGQRIPQFNALGKNFTNVYSQSIDIYDTGFLRVFFNQTEGIVAFETPELFAVLDRKF